MNSRFLICMLIITLSMIGCKKDNYNDNRNITNPNKLDNHIKNGEKTYNLNGEEVINANGEIIGDREYSKDSSYEKYSPNYNSNKESSDNKKQLNEENKIDNDYAEMIETYGFKKAHKWIYQSCINNNLSHDEAINYIIYLNNRYLIKRGNQNLTTKNRQYNSTRLKTNEPTWVDENGNEYTADEIRKMRENDPNHIYKTSGTPVYSNEEIIDQRIKEYEESKK